MTNYPYSSIFINNREVELAKIVSDNEKAQTNFEQSTFSFIRSWINGETKFNQNTSGSTGTPKIISISREQMAASARLTEQALHLMPGYHALICLDTEYIAGKMMLVRCFITGMKILAIDPCANPLQVLSPNQKVDFASFVPYQMQVMLTSNAASRLNDIKTAIIGGAVLDDSIKGLLQSFSCQFYATYGMTETISHIALQKLNGQNASEFFQILPGIVIKKDNRNCLVIQSPFLPEEIHTNDIVEIIFKNSFRWIGRADHVINSGGVKVSPEKLEIEIIKFFRESGIDRSFFVAGLKNETLGEQIVLIVEGEKLVAERINKINLMFKHAFPQFEIPKKILFLKQFIRTTTGKINRFKTIEFLEKRV